MSRLLLPAVVFLLLTLCPQVTAAFDPAQTQPRLSQLSETTPTPSADWQPLPPSLVVQTDSNKVALTFNAASYPPFQPAILDALREAGVRCTVFLTGDFVDSYPELVVQMAREGNEIGNHGDTHADMPGQTDEEMVAELGGWT
ncbi:MAG TPA: polysaccharide deacetylase family protein [Chloroflexota bacterium]|nr:polysaccharide deacetylase family protein [Chloroflexota bacterium]